MDVDKKLEHFFEAIGPLSQQTLALLIQVLPSLRIHEGVGSQDTGQKYSREIQMRHALTESEVRLWICASLEQMLPPIPLYYHSVYVPTKI